MKSWQGAFRGLIVFLLVIPIVVLVWHFQFARVPHFGEIIWAIKNSFAQALFSAVISLLLGVFIASGLLKSPRQIRPLLEISCLLPNFLPAIFSILACMEFFDPFPMGTLGIILVHVVMNAGLVGVILASLIETKIGSQLELCFVEAVPLFKILKQIVFPSLKKDLIMLLGFVFSVCFASFSIPLALGGGKGTTLEVLIFEKMRIAGDWGQAVSLSLIQILLISLLSIFIPKGNLTAAKQKYNTSSVGSYFGLTVLVGIFMIFFVGYISGIKTGIMQWAALWEIRWAILEAFFGTIFIAFLTGVLTITLLYCIAVCIPHFQFEKFLNAYTVPSTALTCFAFLMLGPNDGLFPYIKISIAQAILFILALYKMGWNTEIISLQGQIQSAHIMGAEFWQIFKKIILPQTFKKALQLGGIAGVWSCGDFAISRILAYKNISLGMVTDSMLNGYHQGPAVILSLLILFSAGIVYYGFLGAGYVYRRKN